MRTRSNTPADPPTRRWLWLLVLPVLSILVAACGPFDTLIGTIGADDQEIAEAAPVSVNPTPTKIPTATATPTPLPTPTASPTETSEPTVVTEAAITVAPAEPTATPTVAPTVVTAETPSPAETPSTYPPAPEAVHVSILMYHYISELPADADVYRQDLTVTPGQFEAQLQYLKDQGFESVTLAAIYERLTTGKPLPPKPIVLTFDDGYKDARSGALPLLQAYGFVGEFFVLATPAHYEAPQYLSWNDMKAMSDAGMSIQAHGRDHDDLTNRSYDFLVYQILGAREAVEAHTGMPVRFFCYPSGRYDSDTEAVVASAGYWGAVTTEWGNELRLDNRYAWPRIRIRGAWDLTQFADVLASLELTN